MHNRLILSGVACAALAMLLIVPAARAEGWGNVKGQAVWAGGDIPKAEALKVDKDQGECLKHGPILAEKYVIDPKSKGVRWVMVWLTDPKNPNKGPSPIAPDLKTPKEKKIIVDQPVCAFTPHVLAIRQGQTLEVKNSAKVSHNTKIDGGNNNPNLNQIIAPGSHLDVKNFKPTTKGAIPVSCTIHGWMRGWIRVFNHPYFAVTDAEGNFEIKDIPAGTWNLVVWHEEKGFLPGGNDKGTPVTVTDKGTTDVGKIDVK